MKHVNQPHTYRKRAIERPSVNRGRNILEKKQDYSVLVILGVMGLTAVSLYVIPGNQLITLPFYIAVLVFFATLLYINLVKPLDPTFPLALFWLTFIAKMFGSVGRYWMTFDLYAGTGSDADSYHLLGQYLAQYYSQFDFSLLGTFQNRGAGTTNLTHIVGFLYSLFPANMAGAYLFFAGLAFIGSVFLYCAFRVAFPDTRPHLYRLLVFFLPSTLFWPSSLGKEAWIFFCSGFVAYGVAIYFRRGNMVGLLLAGVGLFAINLIRPHMAAALAFAIGAAYLISLFGNSQPTKRTWIIMGIALTMMATIVLPSAVQFLGLGESLSEVSLEDIQNTYEAQTNRSNQGGSSYTPVSIFNPVGLMLAPITVLFRPFPWEAHNAPAMIASLESIGWFVLFWWRRRVLWERLQTVPKDPWIAFVVCYTFIMILLLAAMGNFGILARQRSLFLPFFWMLLA